MAKRKGLNELPSQCLSIQARFKKAITYRNIAIIFAALFMSLFLLSTFTTLFGSVENPFEDRYDEGYADGLNDGLPEKATININLLDNTLVEWYWNNTYINATQEVNFSVAIQFIPFLYFQYLIDEFRSIANWLDNASGQSYYYSEEDTNLPVIDFTCLENAELFMKTLQISCQDELNDNLSLYNEQIQDLLITNIEYKYTNNTGLESCLETDGEIDNKSSIAFGFPLFSGQSTLFIDLFVMFGEMSENPIENHTIVDYMNSTFFPALNDFAEPYKIDLEDGDTFTINLGNMKVKQQEVEFEENDHYSNFLMSIELGMNGTNYICYSDGVSVVP